LRSIQRSERGRGVFCVSNMINEAVIIMLFVLHSQILCQIHIFSNLADSDIYTHLWEIPKIGEIICVEEISAKNQSKKFTLFSMWRNGQLSRNLSAFLGLIQNLKNLSRF
jgi:hypothetical protein